MKGWVSLRHGSVRLACLTKLAICMPRRGPGSETRRLMNWRTICAGSQILRSNCAWRLGCP